MMIKTSFSAVTVCLNLTGYYNGLYKVASDDLLNLWFGN
jgi:hypothetical protein